MLGCLHLSQKERAADKFLIAGLPDDAPRLKVNVAGGHEDAGGTTGRLLEHH